MRRASIAAWLAFFGALASAQQRLPAPRWVRSVEVVREGTNVRAGPSASAARRGTVQVGTRLPFLGRVVGDGCPGGEWMQVGAEAFVCESLVRYSPSAPFGEPVPIVPEGRLTPREHAFVATDGTWAYARPSDYFADRWVQTLGRGFGVAIVERQRIGNVELARTLDGLWLPSSELRYAQPSDFAGVELAEGEPLEGLAWVIREQAIVRSRINGPVVDRLAFHQRARVLEIARGHARIGDDRWIATRDLAQAHPSAPPAEVGEGERWIDVDLASQTLVAYAGTRPVLATLVSTGIDRSATPRGTYRIWVKLSEGTMDDLEREDVDQNYQIQAVPWVQYFSGSVGLHAAFWHDRFGLRRSHGCVNLAPRDARWLFEFTQPALPPGWDAILPTASERATIVRVR
ncbi:MAG: L,D-transpeptidase family protein [Sandaracinaceae bacterium]|nr:L,D-transpeptidase family protein [Sandaracinaceae bacterium]